MARLQIENITLGYGNKPVLKDISLEVNPGEMVGIVGPNASGKSTLLKAISGVLHPWSGAIKLDGQGISRLSRQNLARLVAVVPQNASLPEAFTVLEIVLMGRYPHLGFLRYESQRDLAIVWNALERTGIDQLAQRRVNELSGGERQRLIIARALAQEPKIILLDEPTAHLDIQYGLWVMELVLGLVQQGIAAIAAIHDFSLAARFCHRLLLLRDGGIGAEGTPQEVLTSQNIETAFGVHVLVYPSPLSNGLIFDPFPKRTRASTHRIHIISGGGRGTEAMRMLHTEGFEVTAGVLNEGDTDLTITQILGIEAISIPPFASIDDKSHEHNLKLVAGADCTIVIDIPFGWANLRNLMAAAVAKRLILVEETPIEQRDFTEGNAVKLYRDLKQRARVTTPQHLLSAIREALTDEDKMPRSTR